MNQQNLMNQTNILAEIFMTPSQQMRHEVENEAAPCNGICDGKSCVAAI